MASPGARSRAGGPVRRSMRRAGATRAPSRARDILAALCVGCLLVSLAARWLAGPGGRRALETQASARAREQEATNLSAGAEQRADRFVWSGGARDWTLAEQGAASEVPPEASPSEAPDPAACVWPEDECPPADRIINQLLLDAHQPGDELLKIAWANDRSLPAGRAEFLRQGCRVNRCELTRELESADAIIWPNSDVAPAFGAARRAGQVWIAYLLESPPNTYDRRFKRRHRGEHEFNWTASYRSDSDLVAPYAKFVPFAARAPPPPQRSAQHPLGPLDRARNGRHQAELSYESASRKHKQLLAAKGARVAWLVSNCHAQNERLEYARKLGRFIQVDIYGKCGSLTCAKANHSECQAQLNANYKFYLAFENSNTREYITEKLYRNAFAYNDPDHLLLPIVMGPERRDYERFAPPGSFIHVDDFSSPEQLAGHLRTLAQDQALYYSYFQWKTMGRFIDTKFLCRACAMLHHQRLGGRASKSYADIQKWWLED